MGNAPCCLFEEEEPKQQTTFQKCYKCNRFLKKNMPELNPKLIYHNTEYFYLVMCCDCYQLMKKTVDVLKFNVE